MTFRYIDIKQNRDEQKSIIASDSESGNIKAFSMAIINKVKKITSEKKKRVFFFKEYSQDAGLELSKIKIFFIEFIIVLKQVSCSVMSFNNNLLYMY